MNILYQRFYEDLKLTGKSPRTIETYEKHLQKLERFFNKPPDQIAGVHLRLIQIYLGHSTPKTTAQYTHLTPQAQSQAWRTIDQLMQNL